MRHHNHARTPPLPLPGVQCLEMITRNAYIYAALKGVGFCEAGTTVFGIILRNVWTLAAINILSEGGRGGGSGWVVTVRCLPAARAPMRRRDHDVPGQDHHRGGRRLGRVRHPGQRGHLPGATGPR
jgi:hypothetical protein